MGAPDRAPGTWLVTIYRNGREVVRVTSGENPARPFTADDHEIVAELLERACSGVLRWPPWFTGESLVIRWARPRGAEPPEA
jgi:hypothetical protein